MIEVGFSSNAEAHFGDISDRFKIETLLAGAGKVMRDEIIPSEFRTAGGPYRWDPPKMRTGAPMIDTGRLRDSFAYEATPESVKVYSSVPYAGVFNRTPGSYYTHKPTSARYIAIPNPRTLTPSQCRGSKPRDFPEAFFLKNAPGGPGIYKRDGRNLILLFFLRPEVQIKSRPVLYWTQGYLDRIKEVMMQFLATGSFPWGSTVPSRDGTPDVGNRGGRP